jgi:hypothetical protein
MMMMMICTYNYIYIYIFMPGRIPSTARCYLSLAGVAAMGFQPSMGSSAGNAMAPSMSPMGCGACASGMCLGRWFPVGFPYHQWIGLRENLMVLSPIFHGKIPMVSGFDFPVNQSIDIRSPLATIHGFIFVDISDTHGINHPQLKLCHWVWQMIPNDLCEQCPMYS